MASTEDDFFFPHSKEYSWTSSESNSGGRNTPNSNIERLLNRHAGIQFDPSNKVRVKRGEYPFTMNEFKKY